MVLILDIIAPNLLALDSTARRVFDAVGGTIGRDGRSDWVLPNPKISGRHARITYVDSVFYIEDTSTNGVYLNSRRNRLVRGQPCALNSGDRLFIDPYAIQVTVASEQDIVSGHPAVSPQPFDNGDILLETDPFDPFADVHSRRAGSRPAPAPELERDDEPDPLILLRADPKYAAPGKVPTASEMDPLSPIAEHYGPPAVMPPPRLPSAPAPVELIPEGYDLLADDVTSGVGIVANKPQPAPVAPQTSERSDTELEFSAYCPRVLRCSSWQDLLVYAHVPSARAGVHADSEQFFGRSARADLSRGRPRTVVLHGAEIQVVPSLSGCEFNPPSASILWLEDWHRIDFRVRALPSDERHRFGSVRFYVGPVLVGELALWTDVATNPVTGSDVLKVEREKAYQAVFVSYSSEDILIVDQLQHAYTVLGMSYVRDIETLRSGQDWNDSILAAIPSADIFQLCWSHAAKRSRFVEREWRCALALRRPRFIRPVFWERPMPSPPDDLAHLHFARLPLPGNTSSGNASTLSTMRQ